MHPLFKTLMTTVPLLVALMWYIARRQASKKPSRAPLPADTEALLFGTRLISDGVHFFPDWSAAMIREFDYSFDQARLEDWHRLAQDLSQVPPDQWRTAVRQSQAAGGP